MHIIAASYRLILKSKHDLNPSSVGSVVFRDNWINWFVTQWRHMAGATLAQIKDCCLTTPSNYVNQHLIRISEVLRHILNSNLIMSAQFRYYVKWVWKIIIFKWQPLLSVANELIQATSRIWVDHGCPVGPCLYQRTDLEACVIYLWIHIHCSLRVNQHLQCCE